MPEVKDSDSVLSDEVDYTGEAEYEYTEEPSEVVENPDDKNVRERMYIYVGDEKGMIKIWSADFIIQSLKI